MGVPRVVPWCGHGAVTVKNAQSRGSPPVPPGDQHLSCLRRFMAGLQGEQASGWSSGGKKGGVVIAKVQAWSRQALISYPAVQCRSRKCWERGIHGPSPGASSKEQLASWHLVTRAGNSVGLRLSISETG